MTLSDFAKQKRAEYPDLADFSDSDIAMQFPSAPAAMAAPAPVAGASSAFDRYVAGPTAGVMSGFAGIGEGIDTVAKLATRQEDFAPVKAVAEFLGRTAAAGEAIVSGREVGEFWAPVDAKDAWQEKKSNEYKQAVAERSAAMNSAGALFGSEGLGEAWAGIKETATSPDLIIDLVAEQIPQLMAMATGVGLAGKAGLIAKAPAALGLTATAAEKAAYEAAKLVAEKSATRLTSGIGAALQGSSAAADRLAADTAQLKQMSDEDALAIPAIRSLVDNGSTLADAKATVTLNAATKTLGLATVGSLLATKLTGGKLETLLGRLGNQIPSQVAGRLTTSALSEFGQEALEEGTGQFAQNVGALALNPDQDLSEGVLPAAGLGGFGGALIGGGLQGITNLQSAKPEVKPAAAAAAAPAAEPRFSYGDIVPPSVDRPGYSAEVTVDGETTQFFGLTQQEAEAKREAYVTQATSAPASEEGAVEVGPDVIASLVSLGMPQDLAKAMTPQQAFTTVERLVAVQPAILAGANAEAEYAASEKRVAALVNASKALELDQTLAAKAAQNAVAQEKSRTELAAQKVKTAEAEAKLVEVRQRLSETRAKRAKPVKVTGEAPVGETPTGPEIVTSPLTGGEGASEGKILSGPVKVADAQVTAAEPAPDAVAEPAPVEASSEKTAPAPILPLTPTQTFSLATTNSTLEAEAGQSEPLVGVGNAARGATRFAAVFEDAQGDRIVVPVFYKGRERALRVLLDERFLTSFGTATQKKQPTRYATQIQQAAEAAGYPASNESTLAEFAQTNGLKFTKTVLKSSTPLTAGIYYEPAGDSTKERVVPSVKAQIPLPRGVKLEKPKLVSTIGSYSEGVEKRMLTALTADEGLMLATDPTDEGYDQVVAAQAALSVLRTVDKIPKGFLTSDIETNLAGQKALTSAFVLLQKARASKFPAEADTPKKAVAKTQVGEAISSKVKQATPAEKARVQAKIRAALVDGAVQGLERKFDATEALSEISKAKTPADFLQRYLPVGLKKSLQLVLANDPTNAESYMAGLVQSVRDQINAPADAPAKILSPSREGQAGGAVVQSPPQSSFGEQWAFNEGNAPQLRSGQDLFSILEKMSDITEGKIKAQLNTMLATVSDKNRAKTAKDLINSKATPALILQAWEGVSRINPEPDPEGETDPREFRMRIFSNLLSRGTPLDEQEDTDTAETEFKKVVGDLAKTENSGFSIVSRTDRPLTGTEQTDLKRMRSSADVKNLLQNLAARGLNVSFTDLKNSVAGRFSDNHVAIFSDWNAKSSTPGYIAALHEATHHFLSLLSPTQQLAMQRGVDQLAARLTGRSDIDPRVGFKNYEAYLASSPTKPLTAQEWATEVVCDTAALEGVSRDVATTWWAGIMRQVKLLSLRIGMYFQEQFLGPEAVNPTFVSDWVNTQIDATIAGDYRKLASLVNRYTGIRPTLGKMSVNFQDANSAWQTSAIDPITGKVTYLKPLGVDSAATEAAVMLAVGEFKEQNAGASDENLAELAALSGTTPPAVESDASIAVKVATREAQAKVAAAAEVGKPFNAALAKALAILPQLSEASRALAKRAGEKVPGAMTRESIAELIGMKLPEVAIQDANAILSRVVQTETGTAPVADLISAQTTLESLTDESTKHKAQEEIYHLAVSSDNRIANKVASLRSQLLEAESKQLRSAQALAKYSTDPKNWQNYGRHISESIAESFEQIVASQDALSDVDARVSEVASMLRQMAVSDKEKAALSKDLGTITAKVSIGDLSLASIMRNLLTLEESATHKVDFSKSVKEIRETILSYVASNPSSSLSVLTSTTGDGDLRGSALLSALISYIRRNELAVELMRANLVKGNSELAALAEFQSIMQRATDQKLDELAALQKAQKELPTNRYIQKALNDRDKFTQAANDVAQMKQDLAVLEVMGGTFSQVRKIAERDLSAIGSVYVHSPEAVFAHPTKADDSIDELYQTSRMKKVGNMTDTELRQVIADVRDYLEANANRAENQGHLFNKLKRQNAAMANALVGDGPKNALSFLFDARLRGFTESLRGAGTKAGSRVAARASKYSALYGKFGTAVKKVSSRYERSLSDFLKVSGVTYETYRDVFYAQATGLAQIYPGEKAEVYDQIDRRLATHEVTKEAWAKPGVKKAFLNLLDACEAGAEVLTSMQKEAGVDLVADPRMINPETGQRDSLRKQIKRGWLTFPQHTAEPLKKWANGVAEKFSINEHAENIFTNALIDLKSNAAEVRAGMVEFLGSDGWREFMAPLLGNDLEGTPAPLAADGVSYNLNTARAKSLVKQANGDFFRFAELAHAGSGSIEDVQDYTVRLIKHVGRVWQQVNTQTKEVSPESSLLSNPGIPNVGLDARVTQTWPISWKNSMEFSDGSMRRASAGIAGVAAFGRNLDEALVDLTQMNAEVDNKIKAIEAKYNKPGVSAEEQMKSARGSLDLSRFGIGESDYQQWSALQNYKRTDFQRTLIGVLNSENTAGLEDPTVMELWGTYVMQLTAGFRSALKNPTSLLNQVTLAGEFSPDSVRDTLGNYGGLLKQVAASVTGAVIPWYDPLRNDVNTQALRNQGIYDQLTDVRFTDFAKGGRSASGYTPPLVRNLRRVKEFVKDTHIGFSYGKSNIALRAFDVFGYTQIATQLAAVSNNLNIYYTIVQAMAEYGRKGGDLSKSPTASQMGLRGSDVRVRNMLSAYAEAGGSDILTLASELASKPSMTEQAVKERLATTVNKIVSDRISSEGSLSNNPAWISKSKIGRIGGTFVGFSLRQTGNIVKPFIDSETNKISAATLMRGSTMLALGMLPGVLAYSMMLDWWDDLSERKRDKMQIRLTGPEASDNLLQKLSEATSDVGAFGFIGDAATTLFNAHQGTSQRGPLLSVDNRVVAISAVNNFVKAFRDVQEYGVNNLTLSTSGMQTINALGGSAWMSNLDTLNRFSGNKLESTPVLGGFITAAGERQDRISVTNYIREAGRAVELPVRMYGTGSGSAPNKITPHIVDMQLAALSGDSERFNTAKEKAFIQARLDTPNANSKEAWGKVASAYTYRHPLRGSFERQLTSGEIGQIMENIEIRYPGKSQMVKESLRDFNAMGQRIPGFKPVVGATRPNAAASEKVAAGRAGLTPEEWRRKLVGGRSSMQY